MSEIMADGVGGLDVPVVAGFETRSCLPSWQEHWQEGLVTAGLNYKEAEFTCVH